MFGPYQNRTKVKCLIVHPDVKLQKVPYKMLLDTLLSLQKTLSVIYDPAVRNSTSLQSDYFPPIIVAPWRNHKSRESNLPQQLK